MCLQHSFIQHIFVVHILYTKYIQEFSGKPDTSDPVVMSLHPEGETSKIEANN